MVSSGIGYIVFGFLLIPLILENLLGIKISEDTMGIAYLFEGIILWFFGKWRENKGERELIQLWGTSKITKYYDTFFYIPIRFWGIILTSIAILIFIF
ncbi:MAG: hypothetical protein NTU44_06075 [Bacteroidetes bacterium]|nr:hypothetical protein [Bacteroidota bacterium]